MSLRARDVRPVDAPASESALLDAVLGAIDSAVAVIDRDGNLRLWNSVFAAQLRELTRVEPVVGAGVDQLIPMAARPRLNRFWKAFVERALSGRELIAQGRVKSGGSSRSFDINARPVAGSGGAAFSIRETTSQIRRAQQELVDIALVRIFSDESDPQRALPRALEALCLACGSPGCTLWFRDAETGSFELMSAWFEHGGEGDPAAKAAEYGDHLCQRLPITSRGELLALLDFLEPARGFMDVAPAVLLEGAGHRLERYLVALRHAREREALETAVERKGREWAETFDALEAPLMIVDGNLSIVRLNRAAAHLAGISPREAAGSQLVELPGEGPWALVAEVFNAVRDSGESITTQSEEENGRHWDIVASPLTGLDGVSPLVTVVLRDVTATVALRESVRRGEQLSAMGELVAGVAHEVRNPLFGISTSLDALELVVNGNDDAKELFTVLRTWIHRLNDLMSQLLEYGKTWSVNLAPGDLSVVVRHAVDLCSAAASERNITIRFDAESNIPPMLMDETRLTQVFSNVLLNAIGFAGSSIVVRLHVAPQAGVPRIQCTVSDDGPGFAQGDLARVFQPFFTRRRAGTGLGLSIVQRIVEEHGGSVSAGNNPSGGAIVTTVFPPIPAGEERASR